MGRVTEIEASQTFISNEFENKRKKNESAIKKLFKDTETLKRDHKSDFQKISLCDAIRNEFQKYSLTLKKMSEAKDNVQKIAKENEKLHSEFESIQYESMRDNLLSHGIEEKENEVCVDGIRKICTDNLLIPEAETLSFKAVFRLGKKEVAGEQNRIRSILVKFNDRRQRDNVRKCSSRLKVTQISITDRYPKSVVEKRKT